MVTCVEVEVELKVRGVDVRLSQPRGTNPGFEGV